MHQQMSRVAVTPGSDRVCRAGEAVFLGRAADPAEQGVLEALVGIVQRGGADAAGDVVRAVAVTVVGAPAAHVPSFGLLARTGGGLTVLLQGDILATWCSDDQEGRLSGTEASTFAERRLPPDVTSVDLAFPDSGEPDDLSNLAGGIVRGSGVRVHLDPGADRVPSGLVADPTEPELPTAPVRSTPASPHVPPEEERTVHRQVAEPSASPPGPEDDSAGTPRFETFDLGPVEQDPEPAGSAAGAQVAPATKPVVMVEGIHCSRGHFNSPRALYCSICGIAMVHQTHRPVRDARPPLGVLVTDDGVVFPIDGDLVIGREPEASQEVKQGSATPLQLEDPALSMSRVHLMVRLVGWDVYLEDADSANGSFVTAADDVEQQLVAGQPTKVLPGARIAIGGRSLSFESHQRS